MEQLNNYEVIVKSRTIVRDKLDKG